MKKKVDITSSKEKLMINRKKKLYQQIHNRKMKIKYGKYDNILDKNEKVDIIDLNKKTNTKRKNSNNINMDYSSKEKLFWIKFFYLEGHNSTKNKLDEKKILFSPSVIQSSKPIFTDIRDKPTIKHMNSFQSLHTECPNNSRNFGEDRNLVLNNLIIRKNKVDNQKKAKEEEKNFKPKKANKKRNFYTENLDSIFMLNSSNESSLFMEKNSNIFTMKNFKNNQRSIDLKNIFQISRDKSINNKNESKINEINHQNQNMQELIFNSPEKNNHNKLFKKGGTNFGDNNKRKREMLLNFNSPNFQSNNTPRTKTTHFFVEKRNRHIFERYNSLASLFQRANFDYDMEKQEKTLQLIKNEINKGLMRIKFYNTRRYNISFDNKKRRNLCDNQKMKPTHMAIYSMENNNEDIMKNERIIVKRGDLLNRLRRIKRQYSYINN
jgi:hypothetical protein